MTEGYLWTGSVPADRAWLTADNPADAMQRYCPQVCRRVPCYSSLVTRLSGDKPDV